MDVNAYKNTVPFPSREDYSKVFYYSKGQVVGEAKANDKEKIKEIRKAFPSAIKEVVEDEEGYRAAREAYGKGEAQAEADFKSDLFAENGLEVNDFTNKLYSTAWASGHSHGFSEVKSHFEDLVELDAIARKTYGLGK